MRHCKVPIQCLHPACDCIEDLAPSVVGGCGVCSGPPLKFGTGCTLPNCPYSATSLTALLKREPNAAALATEAPLANDWARPTTAKIDARKGGPFPTYRVEDEVRASSCPDPQACKQANRCLNEPPCGKFSTMTAPAAPNVAEVLSDWRVVAEFFASRNWPDTKLGDAASRLHARLPALLAKLGQGWIPVSERLPTEARHQIMCLVSCAATEDDPAGVSVATYDEDECEWSHWIDTGCWVPGEVTHWMPLPKPPGASDD